MNIIRQKIGSWQVQTSDIRLRVPENSVILAGNYISDSLRRGSGEDTWPRNALGVQSLFASIKCSVNGHLRPISIDPAPVGIGIASHLSPVFTETLNRVKKGWPELKLLGDQEQEGDDAAWLPKINWKDAEHDQSLLLLRTGQIEKASAFLGRSVAPFRTRFHNHYGVALNLWEEVSWSDSRSFDWEEGFVLRGKNSHIVEIWLPGRNRKNRKGLGGISTKTRISKILLEQGSMYYQRFVEPMIMAVGEKDDIAKTQPMIYKLFFLYDFAAGQHIYAGGLWESLPSVKIHGTPETIFGALE